MTETIAGRVMGTLLSSEHGEKYSDLPIDLVWEVCSLTIDTAMPEIIAMVRHPMTYGTEIARSSPKVMQAIHDEKKIYAIKELRALSGLGLKEAKDVIDVVYQEEHPIS